MIYENYEAQISNRLSVFIQKQKGKKTGISMILIPELS